MGRAFRRTPIGLIGAAILVVVVVGGIVGPPLFGDAASTQDVDQILSGPSWSHPLGTDALGRDILARILVATRLSLELALAAATIATIAGTAAGTLAVSLSPRLRTLALRSIDALLAFPSILVAIFVAAVMGPSSTSAALGVGLASAVHYARVTSTLAMSVGNREYMHAARLVGVRRGRLIVRHVLPNIGETLIVAASVTISRSIVYVSSLSFLGLGVQLPDFDWGQLLTDGIRNIYLVPAAALGPAAAIALTALAFGLTGEALAGALEPSSRRRAPGKRPRSRSATSATPLAPATDLAGPVTNGSDAAPGKVIEVKHLSVTFGGPAERVAVVRDVSFALREGETLGVVGESGSGKTTMALALAQLVPRNGEVSGTIELRGKQLATLSGADLRQLLGTNLAVVFQDPMTSLNPAVRIGRQMTESAELHRDVSRDQARETATVRLGEVGLPAPAGQLARYPHELSGGMRQRVMIAMGLMNNPAVLIADEPTTALDVTIQAQVMQTLAGINEHHGTTIILISHNLALVAQNCDRVLVMYGGSVVEDASAAQLVSEPKHPYTQALLDAVPDIDRPRGLPLEFIAGEAPEPSSLPSGCAFHPRCSFALERCRTEQPPLEHLDGRRRVACWVAMEEAE